MANFGEDDPTIIDGTPLVDTDTPPSLPRCTECGALVFFDDFTTAASMLAVGLFTNGQCVRARDGHWWLCVNFGKDFDKIVLLRRR